MTLAPTPGLPDAKTMTIAPLPRQSLITTTTPPGPRSAEVEAAIAQLKAKHPHRVEVQTAAVTGQGRPIRAVWLTDPTAPAVEKQHVLIAAGHHGNEESGRLIAIDLMHTLLTDAHRETLRRQVIVVMPNVSPDAAEQDCYSTPSGIKPNMDHGKNGPTTPEAKALEAVAHQLQPDVYIDMHARGHAGCSYDMVLYPETKSYTEDDNLFHEIAKDMADAGESQGLPHITHSLTWWSPPPTDEGSSTLWAYRSFKSIVMLTESAEDNDHAYPQELTSRVGVARVLKLIERGNTRHPKLEHIGYPTDPILGMFSAAVVSIGANANERRRCRIDAWRERSSFESIRPVMPEARDFRAVVVEYDGPALDRGIGVLTRIAGHRTVEAVRCHSTNDPKAACDLYSTYTDAISTYVVGHVRPFAAGTWTLEVDLKPHE